MQVILFLKSEDECESYLDTLNERYGNNHDFQQVYFKFTIRYYDRAYEKKHLIQTLRLSLENILIEQNMRMKQFQIIRRVFELQKHYLAKAQSLGIENKLEIMIFTMNLLKIKIISIMPQHAIHKVWDVSCSSQFLQPIGF